MAPQRLRRPESRCVRDLGAVAFAVRPAVHRDALDLKGVSLKLLSGDRPDRGRARGRRLVPRFEQRAEGIFATIVAGEVTIENGKHSGVLPGRLLRQRQPG